jgi:hypothetical protein
MDYSRPINAIGARARTKLEGKKRGHWFTGQIDSVGRQARSLYDVVSNRNPAETDAAHIKKSHTAGGRLLRTLEGLKEKRTQSWNETMATLRQELSERTGLRPAQGVEEVVIQSELRQAILRMAPQARNDLVMKAVEAGDVQTLNAILNAPAYTTGFAPEFLTRVRDLHERKKAPELIEEIDAVVEADYALGVAIETAERGAREAMNEREVGNILKQVAAAEQAQAEFTAATTE